MDERPGIEHLLVVGSRVQEIADTARQKQPSDKTVRGFRIRGVGKVLANRNAQVGHDDAKDAARPENAKTLLGDGQRLVVGEVFEVCEE